MKGHKGSIITVFVFHAHYCFTQTVHRSLSPHSQTANCGFRTGTRAVGSPEFPLSRHDAAGRLLQCRAPANAISLPSPGAGWLTVHLDTANSSMWSEVLPWEPLSKGAHMWTRAICHSIYWMSGKASRETVRGRGARPWGQKPVSVVWLGRRTRSRECQAPVPALPLEMCLGHAAFFQVTFMKEYFYCSSLFVCRRLEWIQGLIFLLLKLLLLHSLEHLLCFRHSAKGLMGCGPTFNLCLCVCGGGSPHHPAIL